MPNSAQQEGKVSTAVERLVLRLETGEQFDVSGHHDDNGICSMAVSFTNGQRLGVHLGKQAELRDATDDLLVHLLHITKAESDPAFAALAPHDPRGGRVTASILG